MKKRKKHHWEKIGLLDNVPEDKKNYFNNAFDFTLNYLLSDHELSNDGTPETLIFPIIRRIGIEYEISNDEIIEMINELPEKYKDFQDNILPHIMLHSYSTIDAEAEFGSLYVENKIKELNKIK